VEPINDAWSFSLVRWPRRAPRRSQIGLSVVAVAVAALATVYAVFPVVEFPAAAEDFVFDMAVAIT
jgi:hypothetical protein